MFNIGDKVITTVPYEECPEGMEGEVVHNYDGGVVYTIKFNKSMGFTYSQCGYLHTYNIRSHSLKKLITSVLEIDINGDFRLMELKQC